jgi:hypothetical protein
MLYASKLEEYLQKALDFVHIYSLFGPNSEIVTKISCGFIPELCLFIEGFLIT